MTRWRVIVPQGKGCVEAKNRKEAIDKALAQHRMLIDGMIKDGSIYQIPELCKEYVPRNGMQELGKDWPSKPSRGLDKRRRR